MTIRLLFEVICDRCHASDYVLSDKCHGFPTEARVILASEEGWTRTYARDKSQDYCPACSPGPCLKCGKQAPAPPPSAAGVTRLCDKCHAELEAAAAVGLAALFG